MKSNLYKIDGNFVNAESSTDAIKTLKKFKKINHAADVEKICNSLEIVPTTENGEMKLFEIMGNEYENSEFNSMFITASIATDAFTKYKENRPKATRMHAKLICFRNDIIKSINLTEWDNKKK